MYKMYIAFAKLHKIVIVYVFVKCMFCLKNNNKDKRTHLNSSLEHVLPVNENG